MISGHHKIAWGFIPSRQKAGSAVEFANSIIYSTAALIVASK